MTTEALILELLSREGDERTFLADLVYHSESSWDAVVSLRAYVLHNLQLPVDDDTDWWSVKGALFEALIDEALADGEDATQRALRLDATLDEPLDDEESADK